MGDRNYQSFQQKEKLPLVNHHEEEEHEEEEPKVSTLELFSDLVIVVSIHVVAEPLEEEDFNQFGLYFARVFFLWLCWHMMTLFMNAAVKMKASDCPFFVFFIFIWMTAILHMAQDFGVNNDKDAVKWYFFLRIFETMIYWRQIAYPYKAVMLEDGSMGLSVSDEWLDSMNKYFPVMAFSLIFCELIPLSLAIHFGHGNHLNITLVIVSIGLILLSFFIGAGIGNRGKALVNAFDADHLQERYELITLIFTGELCFAAGKSGNIVGSGGVLFMAFAAYLLTFKSYPLKGHIKFWERSVMHSVAGLFLYAGVFCAIPAMGSAFARIIEGEEEEEEESKDEGGIVSAGDLLCFAAGAFMVFSAMINLINVDPKSHRNAPKMSSNKRGLLRIFTGVLIWSLAFLIPEHVEYREAPLATVLVPTFALVSTAIEIWAVGSLIPALNK
jgi:low temperature requirement protein LtrA